MTSTPDLGVDLDRLLELAQEAAAAEGHWYSRGFLEAFIDDDDDRLFPATDARFIEAVTPSTVSELIRRLRAAEAGGLDAAWREAEDALPEGWMGPSVGPGHNIWRAFAWARIDPHNNTVEVSGGTAERALENLAAALRESTDV